VPSTVTIRHANPADAELLAELGARTFFETFALTNSDEDMEQYLSESFNKEQQTAELEDPRISALIAEAEQGAAGYAMLQTGPPPNTELMENPIELVRLYVGKEWIGQGIGAMLMQASLNEARRLGHATLWLGVWEHNGRARAFYQKWGFEDFGEHVFQLGADAQNDFLMKRSTGNL
jgi:ribosomal protein S18 acetylase RimI-like enzyme